MTVSGRTPGEPSQDPDVLLDVDGLTVAYRDYDRRKVVRIVDDVSFTLRRGEALGLAGESGCGKTTTALALLGLLPRGLYRSGGRDRPALRPRHHAHPPAHRPRACATCAGGTVSHGLPGRDRTRSTR